MRRASLREFAVRTEQVGKPLVGLESENTADNVVPWRWAGTGNAHDLTTGLCIDVAACQGCGCQVGFPQTGRPWARLRVVNYQFISTRRQKVCQNL